MNNAKKQVFDEIFVSGIKAFGFHGVFEDENARGQEFFVDLRIFLPLADAAASDALEKTVDYSRAAEIAKACVEARPPFRLIERLAGTIAEKILATFPQIRRVEVVVHKPNAPLSVEFSDVGVKISRERRDGGNDDNDDGDV